MKSKHWECQKGKIRSSNMITFLAKMHLLPRQEDEIIVFFLKKKKKKDMVYKKKFMNFPSNRN